MVTMQVMASPESGPAAYMGPQVMIRPVGGVDGFKIAPIFIQGSPGFMSMEHLRVLFSLVNLLTTRIMYMHVYTNQYVSDVTVRLFLSFFKNQINSSPKLSFENCDCEVKPIGGHIIGHASQTRLYFRKGKAVPDGRGYLKILPQSKHEERVRS